MSGPINRDLTGLTPAGYDVFEDMFVFDTSIRKRFSLSPPNVGSVTSKDVYSSKEIASERSYINQELDASGISEWCSSLRGFLHEFGRFSKVWWDPVGKDKDVNAYMEAVKKNFPMLKQRDIERYRLGDKLPKASPSPACRVDYLLQALAPIEGLLMYDSLEVGAKTISNTIYTIGNKSGDSELGEILRAALLVQIAEISGNKRYLEIASRLLGRYACTDKDSCPTTMGWDSNRQQMIRTIFQWIKRGKGPDLPGDLKKKLIQRFNPGKSLAKTASKKKPKGKGKGKGAGTPAAASPPPPAEAKPAGAEPKPSGGDAVPKRTRPCSANEIAAGECK